MDNSDILRHAINIAKLFQAVGDFVTQGEWQDEQPMPARRYRSADELHRHHDEFGDPLNLEDIGLDDMSLSRIVIELSQTRDHFKIWAPYNDSFRKALKAGIPAKSRRWDPDETCWRVDCYWFGNAQELIHDHFPGLERYYTERAIRMCERLAEEDEEEEAAPPPPPRKKKGKRTGKRKSKAKAKYKTKKAPPPEDDDPYETWTKPPPAPPSEEADAYEVLGISPNAPDEVVKAAHKALARKHHTDTNNNPNDKTINKINAAFEKIKEMRGW
jgi:hypothetical protein